MFAKMTGPRVNPAHRLVRGVSHRAAATLSRERLRARRMVAIRTQAGRPGRKDAVARGEPGDGIVIPLPNKDCVMDQARKEWRTSSGIELKPVYTAADLPPGIAESLPGQRPFDRGAYQGMYRTKPWRIFQLSGYGNPDDEGPRIRFLLASGETGFIMEHDRNTADHLYDVDHPEVVSRREDVGMTGAVILGVRDYETVLDGIPVESTYAHPGGGVVQHGPFALACYWTVAERRGISLRRLSGTGQSDFFLTYLGCITKQQVPAVVGRRLNCDIIEFCREHLPHWVPVSIAGYNGADTGLNAYQELAAVMANAVEYLEEIRRRGRCSVADVAAGVGGISLRTSTDIFEDIAKFRAARRLWHRLLSDRYGVEDERALRLRIHALTAGSAMTYQQPVTNIVRGTLMALAGVLGGAQSLGVSGYDEAISIPSDHAHQVSIRIQQVLQEECGLTAVADPLGGSYFIESLTRELDERAWDFLERIQAHGGFIATLDSGWLHQVAAANQVAESAAVAEGTRRVVGVNCHTEDVGLVDIDGFRGTTDAWERGMARLERIRRDRDSHRTTAALHGLEVACRSEQNVMPAMMDAMAADATVGEIGDVYREVFGDWVVPLRV